MRYSKDGLALTEKFESCRLQAYRDVRGVWTIGYGHTAGVKPGDTCTQAEAEAFLRDDVQAAEAAVARFVGVPLTQPEFDALVDFTFNVGAGAFRGSMLLQVLNAGNYALAAAEFERWDKAGGKVVAGLLRRRLAEQSRFRS